MSEAWDPNSVEREEMDVDVLIVGGGAAGLAAAYQVQKQIDQHNEKIEKGEAEGNAIDEPMIVVLEKASEVGAHSLSGAVFDTRALEELIPDYKDQGCPLEAEVTYDAVYYLSETGSTKLPITPPPFHNIGHQIVSISKLNRWLGEKCEEKGINIFPGFAAVEVLYDGNKIIGVRTGDKGLDKNGQPKGNFEPGMLLKSKVTIFAEGTRGSLFKQAARKLNLWEGKNPEVFEEGVKEIIQMPEGSVKPGQVIHTLGYPTSKTVGGSFIYTIPGDKIILGWVGYLNTKDPLFDPHRELQKLKTHPFIRKMVDGGQVVAYGGKTLPAGGYFSMPKLYGDGFLVCGDTAGMVDVKKLKGIHLAMKSGMLAGETAFEVMLKGDGGEAVTQAYHERIENSFVKSQLWKTRNFHQALEKGLFASFPEVAMQEITGGRGFVARRTSHEDLKTTESVSDFWGEGALDKADNKLPTPDNKLFFDKLSSVYMTGTMHDEDSPNHLLLQDGSVCRDTCHEKYNSPCNHFCPASVYEMVDDEEQAGKKRLQINYTNCIHCKTCDIKCPFGNIDWTVPEGGGGPQYTEV